MSNRLKMVFWSGLLVTLVLSVALVLVAARASSNRSQVSVPHIAGNSFLPTQDTPPRDGRRPRNLSLQPEAFNLGRRLGARFSPRTREHSTLIGTLTIGADRKIVTTIRKQTDDGEQVEINIAGSPGSLTWDARQGALSSGVRAIGSNRDLIERLVLDSPDQFVLAQLRGASYYTIARNVRPAEATDDYTGALWNIVRVDDSERDEEIRPRSAWRLYYINTVTGLIDRIVSELQGEQIVAEFSGWTANGEKVPGQITWKRQGQTAMQFSLTNFIHTQQ